MSIVEDFQIYLQQASPPIVDDSTGWPSVRRRVNDSMGHQLVVLTEDGGMEPETPSPEGIGSSTFREPAVQIRVRGEPWDGDAAEAKSQEIFDALHGLLRVTIGYGQYERVKAQTSAPIFIGFDAKSRPEFTISFRAVVAQ